MICDRSHLKCNKWKIMLVTEYFVKFLTRSKYCTMSELPDAHFINLFRSPMQSGISIAASISRYRLHVFMQLVETFCWMQHWVTLWTAGYKNMKFQNNYRRVNIAEISTKLTAVKYIENKNKIGDIINTWFNFYLPYFLFSQKPVEWQIQKHFQHGSNNRRHQHRLFCLSSAASCIYSHP